eukprot:Lithocolla_globosa_v1_NODE_1577_length_2471_cov_446.691639.p1 type:complete len:745 gc:universal NODE_1577_length_2471_cov_446.691639:92-2326(+)
MLCIVCVFCDFFADSESPFTPKKAKVNHDSDTTSPKQPTGEEVTLEVTQLLKWLKKHMNEENKFLSRPHVLEKKGLQVSLQGRKDAMNRAKELLKNLCDVQLARVTNQTSGFDRTKHRIPVCSGMSGLGKTRLLEECGVIYPEGRSLIVSYGNGHSLRTVEHSMGISASFSWRLLYAFFLDGNCQHAFSEFFRRVLPRNASQLSLRVALQTILEYLRTVEKFDTQIFFIGIDEYQTISKLEVKPISDKGLVMDLLVSFLDVICDAIPGLVVLPMLAGTDFSIVSVARSSTLETSRLPMSLLTFPESLAAVESIAPSYLEHAPFARHLFYLGGVPRWIVEYTESVEMLEKEGRKLEPQLFENAFSAQLVRFVSRMGDENAMTVWGEDEFTRLVAFALSGKKVVEGSIGVGGLTWSRIRDSSLCLLEDDRVIIPYAIIHKVASYSTPSSLTLATRLFIRTIASLVKKVDGLVYDCPPWQLWENFGAHFHAARINALQILGETIVPFSSVCAGSLMIGCEQEVLLRPMQVLRTTTTFSPEIFATLPEYGDPCNIRDWVQGENFDVEGNEKRSYVVVNGENGEGVDVFFALKCPGSDRHLVCVDQRKRVAGSLGTDVASRLIERARIHPKNLGEVTLVVGLFSLFPHFKESKANNLPNNSFIVAYDQSGSYHGALQYHPASSPCINVNDEPVSNLKIVLTGKDCAEGAKHIMNERKRKRFQKVEEVEKYLKKTDLQVKLKDTERLRFS